MSRSSILKRAERPLLLAALAGALLLAAPGVAGADGGATATTDVTIGGIETVPFSNPCVPGQTGTAEVTFNAVFHRTDRPADVETFSLVTNITGDFVLTLDTGETITGHFVDTFVIGGGENLTLSDLLIAQGKADDGSPFSLHFRIIQAENGLGVLVVDLQAC
jgi:hypothetical protein